MASNNTRLSPRQKMINLMYIVLTAMLALNVSSDVLNGFKQVEDGLERSTANASQQSAYLYQKLESFNAQNPEKGGVWYRKSLELQEQTSSLYNYIDSLKIAIVKKADGEDGDVQNITRQDDLEASSFIMLSPAQRQGAKLRERIDSYRDFACGMISDSTKRATIENYLSTTIQANGKVQPAEMWETTYFENMPVIAAITILTKIQNDLRYTENEILHTLITNIDEGDMRVNHLEAFVIPDSKNIMRGGKYRANIVLAAIDTTQRPTIFINGKELPAEKNGLYEVICGSTGMFSFDGYLEVPRGDGSMSQHRFSSSYAVVEPSATVSATMMNVFYAGIDNPISISVPGIPNHSIQASMTNGSLIRQGDGWVAKPAQVGQESVITVTATIDGRAQTVANTTFKVRKLPDPTPFIPYKDDKGSELRYKGSKPISRNILRNASGLQAAIDDGLLNISFKVKSFQTVFFDSMGNAMIEKSEGANFSQRQKDRIKDLSSGKRFYISNVVAVGPDGIERNLSPIEVIVK